MGLRRMQGAGYALIAACVLVASVSQSSLVRAESVSPVTPATLSDKEMVPIFENINMPGAKVLSIRKSPVEGFWEVAVENNGKRFVIYVDSSKKYITPGPFIDYTARKDITRERVDELERDRRIDVSRLSLDEALVMGKKEAPIRVVVFTDPG